MNKTTKVLPLQIGALHLVVTIEASGPDTVLPPAPHNAGRRLPENVRATIERLLIEGTLPRIVQEQTGVSLPTIYLMRTRLSEEGKIAVQPLPQRLRGTGRGRGRRRAVDELAGYGTDDMLEDDPMPMDDEPEDEGL